MGTQEPEPKSHVFKILNFKTFVIKIIRGILPVEFGKLLILDILQKTEGEGGGGNYIAILAQNGTG